MLCCLPYACVKLCDIIYLCVFSLLKLICIAVALFQGFQSLEKFRAGAPSTVHSERPLHGLSISIILFLFMSFIRESWPCIFGQQSFLGSFVLFWEICLGAYKQSVKQCKASDFPKRNMPGGIFWHTKLHKRNQRPHSAQRNK